jgi:4-methylaminobutanoate oxidase (formaldehyde-forming)
MGYVRSGSYCYTLGGAVGLFMIESDEVVDSAFIAEGKWEINIAGKIYPAQVSLTPLYDPENKKIKC